MGIRIRTTGLIVLTVLFVLALTATAWAGSEIGTGAVEGTVRSMNGAPLSGGAVHLYHQNPGGGLNATGLYATPDDAGYWSLRAPVDDYRVVFAPAGQTYVRWPFWSEEGVVPHPSLADTVTVTVDATETCDATLSAGFRVDGNVTRHANGLGADNFVVYPWVLDEDTGEWLEMWGLTSSSADGYYDFSLVPGYKYRLQWGDSYQAFPWTLGWWDGASTPSQATTLTGDAGDSMSGLDFVLRVKVASETVAGTDRVRTSIAASQKLYPGGGLGDPDAVLISTGYNWPDALAGAALAYAADGPLLLTSPAPAPMPSVLLAEVQRMKTTGASRAYILGGEPAVGKAVYDQLVTVFGPANVVRLSGPDRYATAAMVATNTIERRGPGNFDGTVMIATGNNFADAMAASPVSAKMGWPIVLAQSDGHGGLSDAMTALVASNATKAIILGSEGAVPSGVATDVANALGGWDHVERWQGPTRIDTAISIAEHAIAYPGSTIGWNGLAFSYGWNYPDALSCGPLVADGAASVILLTPNDPALAPGLKAKLQSLAAGASLADGAVVDKARFLGGTPIPLSQATRAALIDALE